MSLGAGTAECTFIANVTILVTFEPHKLVADKYTVGQIYNQPKLLGLIIINPNQSPRLFVPLEHAVNSSEWRELLYLVSYICRTLM